MNSTSWEAGSAAGSRSTDLIAEQCCRECTTVSRGLRWGIRTPSRKWRGMRPIRRKNHVSDRSIRRTRWHARVGPDRSRRPVGHVRVSRLDVTSVNLAFEAPIARLVERLGTARLPVAATTFGARAALLIPAGGGRRSGDLLCRHHRSRGRRDDAERAVASPPAAGAATGAADPGQGFSPVHLLGHHSARLIAGGPVRPAPGAPRRPCAGRRQCSPRTVVQPGAALRNLDEVRMAAHA